jgi:hypothetical protein
MEEPAEERGTPADGSASDAEADAARVAREVGELPLSLEEEANEQVLQFEMSQESV